MDSDKILVMSDGKVAEFDSPYALLRKPDGIFKSMVEATGPISKVLKEIAFNAERGKRQSFLHIPLLDTADTDTSYDTSDENPLDVYTFAEWIRGHSAQFWSIE